MAATGPTGPIGPTGATGIAGFAQALNVYNPIGPSIAVTVAGVPVPFPSTTINQGFTANGTFDTFTVTNAGTYLITYTIRIVEPQAYQTRVLVNGAEVPASLFDPGTTSGIYDVTFGTELDAGDTLQVQLYAIAQTATLASGNGATLTILRLF